MKRLSIHLVLLIFVACSTFEEDEVSFQEEYESFLKGDIFTRIPDYKLTDAEIKDLQLLGFGGSELIAIERQDLKSKLKYTSFILEGDIEIKLSDLPLLASKSAGKPLSSGRIEQYRTTITANPGVYRISTGAINSPIIREGLTRAVENFNNLNLGISFQLKIYDGTTSGDWKSYLITWPGQIYVTVCCSGEEGGSSGFPYANGAPYRPIKIYWGSAALGIDFCEWVLTHELGHSIGLRHTDYFNRSLSCGGSFYNEGAGTAGAIHIPGTPQTTGVDLDSIMKACFDDTEDGEFSQFDIIALQTLY